MKKIILCSDGTGKKGGEGNSTNVFKMYQLIETDTDQLVLYDDGIGTETDNRFVRFIAKMFGFGFQKNVTFLYRYLSKHYEPGDQIFLFGFSRGAATIRVLADMINKIGLVDRDKVTRSGVVHDIDLYIQVMKAMYYYRGGKEEKIKAYQDEMCITGIQIEFVGVWDTVLALGLPKDSSFAIIWTARLLEKIFPKKGYQQQLDKNVNNVYHALAVDEDRRTFHPELFDERAVKRPKHIEQVWFPGVHANVGGGYPRTELSSIPLVWMVDKAKKHGLRFHDHLVEDEKHKCNVMGQIYNPRAGLLRYYRFDPRHISKLSHNKLVGNPKIHSSVIERIRKYDYYPILPNEFDIVDLDVTIVENSNVAKEWKAKANLYTKIRKMNYHVMFETLAVMIIMTWWLFKYGSAEVSNSVIYKTILGYLPNFMENFFYYVTHVNPWLGVLFFFLVVGTSITNNILKWLSEKVYKRINWHLLRTMKKDQW